MDLFIPEPTVYVLRFEDESMDGLVIRAKCCTVAEFNEMIRTGARGTDIQNTADANDDVLKLFVEHLVEWNIGGTDGKPLPMSMKALSTLESPFVNKILAAWQLAMVTVPKVSNSQSSNGKTSREASLGLGKSSKNLGN